MFFFFPILRKNGDIGDFRMYLKTCVQNGSIITHISEFIHNKLEICGNLELSLYEKKGMLIIPSLMHMWTIQ